MSLYNMLHGINPAAGVLLAMLGIGPDAVPRFRDCYLTEDKKIAVYTRTGGGNRHMYESEASARKHYPEYFDGKDDPKGPWNADLRKLPGFLYDENDDYDSTYATFYFSVPEKFAHLLEKLPEGVKRDQLWQETLDRLRTATPDDPQVKKLSDVLAPVFDSLKNEDTPATGTDSRQ